MLPLSHMQSVRNFIEGGFSDAAGGRLEVFEPATGKVLAQAPDSDPRDVDRAVEAAARAFPAWSRAPAEERSRLMLRVAELIERNLEELAELESRNTGKPISLARRVDIPRAVANFRFFATAILHTRDEMHRTEGKSAAINYTLRLPLGVCACISPWNLPLYLFTWKVAPALAAGNTVVGKPSEVTPMTAHRLAELCVDAGLPPGVLNIVHGTGAKAGAAIVAHPDVRAISFTGGTVTGEAIARAAGPMFKKLSLELGGKNPNIIFADAEYDAALRSAVHAAFTNQGEVCLCGSRIFVERTIYDRFIPDFVAQTKSMLKIGDPMEESTTFGAIVSKQHFDKIMSYFEIARREGGEILCGGNPVPRERLPERCREGWFIQPTVITGLGPKCRTNQEEIFGPVVTIKPFDSEDEAIEMANCTKYGLSSAVWTTNLSRAHRMAERIDAGTVWINCWLLRDLRVPFGGMKHSGVGREGGEEALRFFTEAKNVCVKM
jgi:aminomuconate-semialdehyde/2-hydroxymuconate-6-semialdehyde dehydrogenase